MGSCSDTSLSTEADCIAPGTCDDAGNTHPADSASCTALYSDTGSCSDTSLSTEADCIAPGTCDDAGNTNPADSASCTALFSVLPACSPPGCTLAAGTDCSVDTDGNDTGCIYTAPVPVVSIEAVSGFCSDPSATYHASAEAVCSDSSLTTEAECLAVGTCNDAGNTNPADEASSVAAEWTAANSWAAAVVESCTECIDYDLGPRASGASTIATAGAVLATVVAQTIL